MNWLRNLHNERGKKGKRKHHRNYCRHFKNCCISLNDTMENKKYLIMTNPDKKTNEMGMHAGAIVTIIKNHETDSNLIVAIGDARYIIPRDLAKEISVK